MNAPVTDFTFATPAQSTPLHQAEDLLKGEKTANIALGDQVYTLRLTRAGKLLLTK